MQTKIKEGTELNNARGKQSDSNLWGAKPCINLRICFCWRTFESTLMQKLIFEDDMSLNFRRHVWNLCLPQPPHPKNKERNPWHSDQGERIELPFTILVSIFSSFQGLQRLEYRGYDSAGVISTIFVWHGIMLLAPNYLDSLLKKKFWILLLKSCNSTIS